MTPPIGRQALDRLRLSLNRSVPTRGLGALRRRRMGQSQEFREFREYAPGDDIRRVDWQASLRRGADWERVSRVFESDEQATVAILIDCRAGMYLPEALPKVQIAIWMAQCLASVVAREGNRLVLGTLFGGDSDLTPTASSGNGVYRACRRLCQVVIDKFPQGTEWEAVAECHVGPILRQLGTVSATILISDMLFDAKDPKIRHFAKEAHRGYRTLNIVELNAWPMERALLAAGPLRLGAMEGVSVGDTLWDATNDILVQAERNLLDHRRMLQRAMSGPGLIWPQKPIGWPTQATPETAAAKHLFRREFPRAVASGGLMTVSG
ncbi:MAG: DUF58 domain-containing protein [Nisaea sp.]|uniref:DUF58 domain-containing protein n=1 Tax=Nisaea sp. TaxID=2024842 RepID=UPI003263656C